MRLRELFTVGGIIESTDGRAPFLDRDNCIVVNKTKKDDSIVLHLKRGSDDEEGRAYLKVHDKHKNSSSQLLDWAFMSKGMINLTISQLEGLETNLDFEKVEGRMQLIKG